MWIGIGLSFTFVMWAAFGGGAAGEYLSGYLIEESLTIDNVFVWALILSFFAVPRMYQHRVLFWGIFGALVLRAMFIFAGVALLDRFEWVLLFFGASSSSPAVRLVRHSDEEVDPEHSRVLKVVRRVCRRPRSTTAPSCSPATTGGSWPHRCSRCWWWSRPPTWCSRSTPSRPCSPSAASSSSCSRPTRSPSSACGRCTSCWRTCTTASSTYSRAWRVILAFVGVKMILSRLVPHHPWISLAVIGAGAVLSILLRCAERRHEPPTRRRAAAPFQERAPRR